MDLQELKIDRSQSKPRGPAGRRRPTRNPWPLRLTTLGAIGLATWLFWSPLAGWVDAVRLPKVQVIEVVESHPASVGAVRGAAANGYVVASRRAALSADTPGRIVELRVTEGSVVAEGDIVARLFSDEYEAALERTEADARSNRAAVASAEATLAAARSDQTLRERDLEATAAAIADAATAEQFAKAQYDRVTGLFDVRIAPQRELDDAQERFDRARAQHTRAQALHRSAESAVTSAKSRVDMARADVQTAQARVEVADAAVKQAAATLDKTTVRAPFDGIVVLKDAEVGEVVSPNSQGGSNARGSVCTMVDFDSLEVQADVPETSLDAVRVGAMARIFLDAYPDRPYEGRVDRIWPTADRQKATVEVRVRFAQRDERLRPDMGVRVVFLEDTEETAGDAGAEPAGEPSILIPTAAVIEAGGATFVFVVERDVVQRQDVALGERRSSRVTVKSGLRAGQSIVLEPPASLASGDRVQIQG